MHGLAPAMPKRVVPPRKVERVPLFLCRVCTLAPRLLHVTSRSSATTSPCWLYVCASIFRTYTKQLGPKISMPDARH